MIFRIHPEAYRSMIAHVYAVHPYEAVGILGGKDSDYALLAIALDNIAPPGSFLADPLKQFLAERRLRDARLQIVAIYHSHPHGCGEHSAVDRMFAKRRDCVYLVIAPECKCSEFLVHAYRLNEDLTEIKLLVEQTS
jgi:proteasome lid subunit RPN8/RPN11